MFQDGISFQSLKEKFNRSGPSYAAVPETFLDHHLGSLPVLADISAEDIRVIVESWSSSKYQNDIPSDVQVRQSGDIVSTSEISAASHDLCGVCGGSPPHLAVDVTRKPCFIRRDQCTCTLPTPTTSASSSSQDAGAHPAKTQCLSVYKPLPQFIKLRLFPHLGVYCDPDVTSGLFYTPMSSHDCLMFLFPGTIIVFTDQVADSGYFPPCVMRNSEARFPTTTERLRKVQKDIKEIATAQQFKNAPPLHVCPIYSHLHTRTHTPTLFKLATIALPSHIHVCQSHICGFYRPCVMIGA